MANFHTITVSEGPNIFMNNLYLYGNSVNCILNAGERRGPIRVFFDKMYDIKVYVSEKFQDPQPDNATWPFERPQKAFYLSPSDIKPANKKAVVYVNK